MSHGGVQKGSSGGATHDDMIAPRLLQHVGDELSSDGGTALVLFVLSGVREKRHDGGDAFRARNFARMNHDTELHQSSVHHPTAGVDDVHVILADALCNVDLGFTNPTLGDFGHSERQAKADGLVRLSGSDRTGSYRFVMISASSGWLVPVVGR